MCVCVLLGYRASFVSTYLSSSRHETSVKEKLDPFSSTGAEAIGAHVAVMTGQLTCRHTHISIEGKGGRMRRGTKTMSQF